MRLFLSDPNSIDEATSVVLQNIEAVYESEDFVQRVGSGLMKITFLVGDRNRGENAVKEDGTQDEDSDGGGGVGSTMTTGILFVVAGSAALVVVVASVYMWRRFRGSSQDGMVTQFAGDSLETSKSGTPRRPSSPDALSELIPGSYRLGDNTSILSNSNMSPVYELEDDSVVVSESGYSTEAGAGDSESENATYVGLMAKYSDGGGSTSTPDYLGARPMPGAFNGNLEDLEAPSDSDLDTSGETLSPVKIFANNAGLQAGSNANMLDNGDVETPSSSSEDDDALLFDVDEHQEKEEEEKKSEDISSGSPGGKSDINGSCAKSDINGSCAKSDIYTVFSPAKDNNNHEESPLRGEDLEQQR